MRIIVPHVGTVDPEVSDALMRAGAELDLETVDVSGSERAYFDLLCSLWADGQTFAIVEHDIIVNRETLLNLAYCDEDWCACPYEYLDTQTYGLGCTKFTSSLIARNPKAMIRVGVLSDAWHPKRHWCRLDAWLQGVILPNAGETLHKHETPVTHLGRGCAHGCTTAA